MSLALRAIDGVRAQPALPHLLQGADQPAGLAAGKFCERLFEKSLTKILDLLGSHAEAAGELLDIIQLAGRRPAAGPAVAAAWRVAVAIHIAVAVAVALGMSVAVSASMTLGRVRTVAAGACLGGYFSGRP